MKELLFAPSDMCIDFPFTILLDHNLCTPYITLCVEFIKKKIPFSCIQRNKCCYCSLLRKIFL